MRVDVAHVPYKWPPREGGRECSVEAGPHHIAVDDVDTFATDYASQCQAAAHKVQWAAYQAPYLRHLNWEHGHTERPGSVGERSRAASQEGLKAITVQVLEEHQKAALSASQRRGMVYKQNRSSLH
jgi:hypothetical protein